MMIPAGSIRIKRYRALHSQRGWAGAHPITLTAELGGAVMISTPEKAVSTSEESIPMREQRPVISRTGRISRIERACDERVRGNSYLRSSTRMSQGTVELHADVNNPARKATATDRDRLQHGYQLPVSQLPRDRTHFYLRNEVLLRI